MNDTLTNSSEKKLRVCLIGQKIQIQSRASDTGLLWPMAKGLAQKGHDVTIISTTSPLRKPEVFRDRIRAFYLYDGPQPSRSWSFSDAAHKMFGKLHQEKPFDLVHSVDRSAFKIGRHKKNFKVPVAYDIQAVHLAPLFALLTENDGTIFSQIKMGLKMIYQFTKNYFLKDRGLLLTADGMFTTTPEQRILLERYFLYPDYHTYTVPYGINLGDLTERPESESFKMKLQLPEEAQIVMAISDFLNVRELVPLLAAFEDVALKHSNAYLVLVGNGPAWKDVEFEVLKKVLSSRVIMTGSVNSEELLTYITHSKVYINLSSRSTGLEPSLIEAMAQKKVIIGSELSPIAEIIDHGHDGFLVRPADEKGLEKLLSSILQNYNQFSEITENARQKVLDVFDREKLSDALLVAYYDILEKNGLLKRRER